MKFYLGTHRPSWVDIVSVPWFVSVATVKERKTKLGGRDWILDSGGFTQIGKHGSYQISAQEYARIIEFHLPRLAFCQDWMCEAHILVKTGLTVRDHQERTLQSYLDMREMTGLVAPVLQGWSPKEYAEHVQMYQVAGVDMSQLFGVGTICSRNGKTTTIKHILRTIHEAYPGIRLHGFGLKSAAFSDWHVVNMLESADSMAWSFHGRMGDKICQWCNKSSCANCMEYALLWRKKILQNTNRTQKQLEFSYGGVDLFNSNHSGEPHHSEIRTSGDYPGCVHADRSGFGFERQTA